MRSVPPVISVENGRNTAIIGFGLAAAAAGALALYLFDPARHGFYPRCFFKMATSLDCPGCGGLRATHQLLHGNLAGAFALNPLFVMVIPILAFWGARSVAERVTQKRWRRLISTPAALWLGAAIVVAFGIVRNLPWRAWLN
jgi:hypothetical protein